MSAGQACRRAGLWLFAGLLSVAAQATGIDRSAPTQPRAHALLIGVSAYPSLGQERQLVGPANDVRELREVLRRARPDWHTFVVLADGVSDADGLPERRPIITQLRNLSNRVAAGDFVLLYFSGHGSQQPATEAAQEPDGLDEIFLPRDVGRWDGRAGFVKNAISDNEVNGLIAPLLRSGAHVWAIFDTCHSGTMTRGRSAAELQATEERQRAVMPRELGVPAAAIGRAVRRAPAMAPARAPLSGNLIVFSASRSFETTPELRLPPDDPQRVTRGLFTYSLVQAISALQAATYADWAAYIEVRYRAMNRISPQPVFEGSLAEMSPLFTVVESPVRSTPARPAGNEQ